MYSSKALVGTSDLSACFDTLTKYLKLSGIEKLGSDMRPSSSIERIGSGTSLIILVYFSLYFFVKVWLHLHVHYLILFLNQIQPFHIKN